MANQVERTNSAIINKGLLVNCIYVYFIYNSVLKIVVMS